MINETDDYGKIEFNRSLNDNSLLIESLKYEPIPRPKFIEVMNAVVNQLLEEHWSYAEQDVLPHLSNQPISSEAIASMRLIASEMTVETHSTEKFMLNVEINGEKFTGAQSYLVFRMGAKRYLDLKKRNEDNEYNHIN